jgi:hypothetical protein
MRVRKGQGPETLERGEFERRFLKLFADPAFESEKPGLARMESIAWDAYQEGRKAPVTRKAGPEFADPSYELSVEWLDTRRRLEEATKKYLDPSFRSRVLVGCEAARNDKTAPHVLEAVVG